MQKNIVEINFYFPNVKNVMPEDLSSIILKDIKKEGRHNYLGYRYINNFKETLNFNFGDKKIKEVKLTENNRKKITEVILAVHKKFETELRFKYKPIRFFLFPWFPGKSVMKEFGGVTGMAPYFSTIHLYINVDNFSKTSLKETLAHELNHLYFFEIHKKFLLSVKESIILEGFAETFREYLVGGKIAPWSKYLSSNENIRVMDKLKDKYNLPYVDNTNIFFGGNGIKKWTGYSLGYFLVRRFIKNNKNMNWGEIMNVPVDSFFKLPPQ